MLADNTKAFPTSTEVAELLTDEYETWDREGNVKVFDWPVCPYLDASLAAHLSSLTMKELRSNVGTYLSTEQMQAILARRDGILATCGNGGGGSSGSMISAQRLAAARPNTTRSSSELEPSRLAPCTETQAASPIDNKPWTAASLSRPLGATASP